MEVCYTGLAVDNGKVVHLNTGWNLIDIPSCKLAFDCKQMALCWSALSKQTEP